MFLPFCIASLRAAALVGAALLVLPCAHAADAPASAAASSPASAAPSAVLPNTMRVHYNRAAHDEAIWGVYSWEGPKVPSVKWIADRFMFTQKDAFGGYVDIPLAAGKTEFRFLITDDGGRKNCNTDQYLPLAADVASKGQEMWALSGSCEIFSKPPTN